MEVGLLLLSSEWGILVSLQTPGIHHSSFQEPSPGFISLFLKHFIWVCSKLSKNEEENNLLEGLNLKSDQGCFLEVHFILRAGHATTPV